jgi:hypothetical protein
VVLIGFDHGASDGVSNSAVIPALVVDLDVTVHRIPLIELGVVVSPSRAAPTPNSLEPIQEAWARTEDHFD